LQVLGPLLLRRRLLLLRRIRILVSAPLRHSNSICRRVYRSTTAIERAPPHMAGNGAGRAFPSGDDPVFVRRPATCLASDDAIKQSSKCRTELTFPMCLRADASRVSPGVDELSSIIESFRRNGRWSSSRAFGGGSTHRYGTAPSWFDDAAASMGWGRPFEHVRTAFG
jgi:hypothetical protein